MAATSPYVQKPAEGRVFVGNIPMYATEEELASACSVFGPVVFFKLIIDNNTGKHKGYGFCQFRDQETALSAHRNQKCLHCQGRQLRVGMAHSAEERRKYLANKAQVQPTSNIKEQTRERERELDVFALRQLMKLRQQAKPSPKKRENPSDGSSTSCVAAGPPAKKPNLTMYEEDRLRQAGNLYIVPTAVVLEYYATSTKTEGHGWKTNDAVDKLANHDIKALIPPGGIKQLAELNDDALASSSTQVVLEYATGRTKTEDQTHIDIMMRTNLKEIPCTAGCAGSDQLANHKASPLVGGIKKEQLNSAATSSTSSARLDYVDLQPNIHADLIALLGLLKGEKIAAHDHHQHIGPEPKHSLQIASPA